MLTLQQIISELGGELRGNNVYIKSIAPAEQALANNITFLANPKYKQEVLESKAGAIIVSEKSAELFPNRNLIVVSDPYLYFAQVARLFSPIVVATAGIHPTAVIEDSAHVPESCEIRCECVHWRTHRFGRTLSNFSQFGCGTRLLCGR